MRKTIKNIPILQTANRMHYLCITEHTASYFLKAGHKRVLVHLDDHSFHAAILHNKESGYYIYIQAALFKKLHLKKGQEITVSLEPDTTDLQFEIPEEFAAILETDPEAALKFKLLTPGNKRSLLYLIGQPTSSEKRIERGLKIAEKIKQGITNARLVLR